MFLIVEPQYYNIPRCAQQQHKQGRSVVVGRLTLSSETQVRFSLLPLFLFSSKTRGAAPQLGLGLGANQQGGRERFFIFIFFISVFYKNIFSIWKFTKVYPGRPAAGRPGPGRPAAGRGLSEKKDEKNCRQVPGDRSPGSWAAGLPGRPATGQPAFFCILALFAK